MRKLLVALAALALCAGAAAADNNVQNQGSYYVNRQTGAKTDALGVELVTEAYPIVSQAGVWIPLINDSTAVGMADSSEVQTQYANYIIHGLYIRASLPTGGVTNCRLAVSIRTHLFGLTDSLSTTPVLLSHDITAIATGADSLKFGMVQIPSPILQEDDEFIVTLSNNNSAGTAKWVTGTQRYIPLETPGSSAPGVRLPNFSVRERVLGGSNTNTITVYAYCTVTR